MKKIKTYEEVRDAINNSKPDEVKEIIKYMIDNPSEDWLKIVSDAYHDKIQHVDQINNNSDVTSLPEL